MITPKLVAAIKDNFSINWYGQHGISHWARVYEIGAKLAYQNGAIKNVVQLFAIFHDSGRHNEHQDPKHGSRGATLASQLRSAHFPMLTDHEFHLLHQACCLHTNAACHEDITVQTCFDADRLDLGRVGKKPDPQYLCTEAAKTKTMIEWAYEKSLRRDVPNNILGTYILQGN